MKENGNWWAQADLSHSWHPFTDQEQWERESPVVITRGDGCWLHDVEGRRFFDGNASIWTNIHGHGHPSIVRAIQEQAARICHSSYLGLANDRASELAVKLSSFFPAKLERCFFFRRRIDCVGGGLEDVAAVAPAKRGGGKDGHHRL